MLSFGLIFILQILALSAFDANYTIDSWNNCSNVYRSNDPSSISYPYVTTLGKYNTLRECQQACLSHGTNNNRCDSYTYYHDGSEYNSTCYAYMNNTVWIPYCINQTNIDTGRIIYPCKSDIDCSLNGNCNLNTGKCECNPAWHGYKCGNLTLLPATKGTGYNYTDNGYHTSSWGASIQYNKDENVYDMFVAEFANHCGINSWLRNSKIMHAQSEIGKYNSKYTRKSELLVPFAHSPGIIYAPNTDEYALIYVHNLTDEYGIMYPPCECIDGTTINCPNITVTTCNMTEVTSIRYIKNLSNADDINAWSEPILLYNVFGSVDSNFAGQINNDGSLIGMMRKYSSYGNQKFVCCHNVYLVTASNWKDNTTYKVYNDTNNGLGLFPFLPLPGTEDMYPYKDCNGNWHALFHNRSPDGGQSVETATTCGGHAFSKDGINWIYSGVAYTNTIQYDNGESFTFSRRERPHLVFDTKDGCTPVLLSTSAEYYEDATFTFVQPIKQ